MHVPLHGFSARRAAEIAGISYRQIDYWCRIGLVQPSITDANGSGSRRLYSIEDVRLLSVVSACRRLGARPLDLARPLNALALLSDEEWVGPLYVSSRGVIGRDLAVLGGAGTGWVLDLSVFASPDISGESHAASWADDEYERRVAAIARRDRTERLAG